MFDFCPKHLRVPVIVVSVLVVLALLLMFAKGLQEGGLERGISEAVPVLIGIGFLCVMGFIGQAILRAVEDRRDAGTACPFCRRLRARTLLGKDIVKQEKRYGLVSRKGTSMSLGVTLGPNNRTHPSVGGGLLSFEQRAPVTRTSYAVHFQCNECQATWTENEVVEVEDFDRGDAETLLPSGGGKNVSSLSDVPLRTWTDATGRFTIHARFGGTVGDMVILRRDDGSEIQVGREQLSEPDQSYLDQWMKQ
jgi:hypothetical protein